MVARKIDPATLTLDSSLADVYDSLTDIQKVAVDYLVGEAAKNPSLRRSRRYATPNVVGVSTGMR